MLNPGADPSVPKEIDTSTITPTNREPDNDALTLLQNIRINNLKNVIIGQLNINSLRNKFHALVEMMHERLDIGNKT